MIYDTLAIFSESELVEIESLLSQSVLMSQRVKNQLVKAVQEYRYLTNKLSKSKGVSKQVILFLLNSQSLDSAEVQEFLIALEYWVVVLENENEQRMYAEILRYSYFEMDEILVLRSNLIDILFELEEVETVTKNTKIPMQLDPNFEKYATWMMNYGSEFDFPESTFNIVPNLKGKLPNESSPYYDSFSVYVDNYEVPTL